MLAGDKVAVEAKTNKFTKVQTPISTSLNRDGNEYIRSRLQRAN